MEAAVAQQRYYTLQEVRKIGDRGEPEKAGRALDAVDGAQQPVEQGGVVLVGLQPDQVGLEGFEVLAGLLHKQGEHFGLVGAQGD